MTRPFAQLASAILRGMRAVDDIARDVAVHNGEEAGSDGEGTHDSQLTQYSPTPRNINDDG